MHRLKAQVPNLLKASQTAAERIAQPGMPELQHKQAAVSQQAGQGEVRSYQKRGAEPVFSHMFTASASVQGGWRYQGVRSHTASHTVSHTISHRRLLAGLGYPP